MIPRFKAWDPEEKKLWDVRGLFYLQGQLTLLDLTDLEKEIGRDAVPEEVILLQSTGLKDKNGVEIFEGDVVKTISGNKQIVFSEDIACFEAVCSVTARGLYGYIRDSAGVEVIGNKWEHPELLEGK